MSEMPNLDIKQIYAVLCPKCKKMLEQMVKDKVADEMVKRILEDKGP